MMLGTLPDGKVHRIEGAVSHGGDMRATAFCKKNGKLTEPTSDVITCPECAEIHRKLTLERLVPPTK